MQININKVLNQASFAFDLTPGHSVVGKSVVTLRTSNPVHKIEGTALRSRSWMDYKFCQQNLKLEIGRPVDSRCE